MRKRRHKAKALRKHEASPHTPFVRSSIQRAKKSRHTKHPTSKSDDSVIACVVQHTAYVAVYANLLDTATIAPSNRPPLGYFGEIMIGARYECMFVCGGATVFWGTLAQIVRENRSRGGCWQPFGGHVVYFDNAPRHIQGSHGRRMTVLGRVLLDKYGPRTAKKMRAVTQANNRMHFILAYTSQKIRNIVPRKDG